MNKKYQIWDKQSSVITPVGEVFTAEEWKERYPMSKIDGIDIIVGGGTINGSVCMEYTETISMYERMGCDFSECETKQDHLDKIEQFEDEQARSDVASPEERIAAALEAQTMMAMEDLPE